MAEEGPFDRILKSEPPPQRDRAAVFVVAATIVVGIVLLILVFSPISIFDGGDDGGSPGNVNVIPRDDLPELPQGFEAVSALHDLQQQGTGPPDSNPLITVPLSGSAAEGEVLSVYTYRDGDWDRLGDASVLAGGTLAQAELAELPANVIVLRQTSAARTIAGTLPPGQQPDPAALDVLTVLNPRGFSPGADGTVVGDRSLIPDAAGVPVAPVISVFRPAEIAALDQILASPDAQAAHVAAIQAFIDEVGAAGIDLDYRSVDPSRADGFVSFIQSLSTALHADRHRLGITLPLPVESASGWDTSGFDWEALVPLVDAVKVAVEPDPTQYHARTNAALAYLVPRVGGAKLLLTVGPLSRERSVDGWRTLSLQAALTLASAPATESAGPFEAGGSVAVFGQNLSTQAGGTGLQWDETARAVSFSYTGAGGQRTVWLANAFSEAFKLDLARRYGLGGIAVENVSVASAQAGVLGPVRQFAESGEVSLVSPNAALLEPAWTATGGELDQSAGTDVIWSAPQAPGTYTITLVVSDGVVRVGQQLELQVQAAAGAAAR